MKHQLSDADHSEDEGEYDLKEVHSCTDFLCCAIFLVALLAFGGVYASALQTGDVRKIYHGIDWAGQVCGVDSAVAEKPYLYWCASASAAGGSLSLNTQKPVCVSACPGDSITSIFYEMNPECALVSGSLSQMVSYKTKTFHYYCVPDTSNDQSGLTNQVSSQLDSAGEMAQQALGTIPTAWPLLLMAVIASILVGYFYLVTLRHCSASIIWLLVGLCVVSALALTTYLWMNAGTLFSRFPEQSAVRQMLKPYEEHEEMATKIAAAVSLGVAVLLIFVAQCLSHSIHVAAACVAVACEALFEMPSLLLAPITKVALKVLALAVLIYGFLMLYSSCELSTGQDGVLRHFSPDDNQKLLLIYYLAVAIWIFVFLTALYQFTVAYSVAEYYYTPYNRRGEKDVGACEILEGLQVGIMYHPGSLALGSFLITLLTLLQFAIEYAERQNQESGGNRVITCLLSCLQCLVGCCKEIVQKVNKNAYIDMAITSNNFCDAAGEALSTIASMLASMGILNGATVIFSIFGVISSSLLVTALCYWTACSGMFADTSSPYFVESPISVSVVCFCISAFVSYAFMDVIDMASDTLLYCYTLDKQHGSSHKTAPQPLQELFS